MSRVRPWPAAPSNRTTHVLRFAVGMSLLVIGGGGAPTSTRWLNVAASAAAQDVVVVAGATAITAPGEPPLENAAIVIENSRIKEVGPASRITFPRSARVMDAAGKWVIPGLADMHIHPGNGFSLRIQALQDRPNFRQDLAQLFARGFTTVFSTSGPALAEFVETRSLSHRDDTALPRLFGVGLSLTKQGGHASRLGAYTPETPDEARTTVRELEAADVDAIKFIYDDMASVRTTPIPMMSAEVMRAIVNDAHKQGMKAYVHGLSLHYAKTALRAGADGVVHAIVSEPVDDEFITLMKKNQAV
jgi:imidazolonepropionase-like amidohydrolase